MENDTPHKRKWRDFNDVPASVDRTRSLTQNDDVNTAFDILYGMKLSDPGFILRHTEAVDGTVRSIFWCDSQSRAEYEAYSDVLALDSTYKTDADRFPLVIFSGRNNHGKNIIFGAGILHEEASHCYRWILEAFIEAMNNKKPGCILTDQNASICSAIKYELEGTRHRLYLSSVKRNAAQHVKGKFRQEFAVLAARKCTRTEFEERWEELIVEYKVSNIPWVKNIYETKELWCEAFFSGVFFAGMSTTGRAYSVNLLLRTYLNKYSTVTEFFRYFFSALNRNRSILFDLQVRSEMQSEMTVAPLTCLIEYETDAFKKCTRDYFLKLRNNIVYEQGLVFENPSEFQKYRVEHRTTEDFIFLYRAYLKQKQNSVLVNIGKSKFKCDCQGLETEGIPCTHMITTFKILGLIQFPPGSINSRWLIETGKRLRVLFPDPSLRR